MCAVPSDFVQKTTLLFVSKNNKCYINVSINNLYYQTKIKNKNLLNFIKSKILENNNIGSHNGVWENLWLKRSGQNIKKENKRFQSKKISY